MGYSKMMWPFSGRTDGWLEPGVITILDNVIVGGSAWPTVWGITGWLEGLIIMWDNCSIVGWSGHLLEGPMDSFLLSLMGSERGCCYGKCWVKCPARTLFPPARFLFRPA